VTEAGKLGLGVGVEHLAHVVADHQRVEFLQVG
jgi:hypothetical protein